MTNKEKIKQLRDDIQEKYNEIFKLERENEAKECKKGKHNFEYFVKFKNNKFNDYKPLSDRGPEGYELETSLNHFGTQIGYTCWFPYTAIDAIKFITKAKYYKKCTKCGKKEKIEMDFKKFKVKE